MSSSRAVLVGLSPSPSDPAARRVVLSSRAHRLGRAQLARHVLVRPRREEEAVALPLPAGRRLHRLELRAPRALVAESLLARDAPEQHSRGGRRVAPGAVGLNRVIRADGAAPVAHVLRAHPPAPRGLRQRRAPEGHDPGAQAALQPLRRDVRSHKRRRDVHAPLGLAAAVEAAPLVPLVLGQVVLLRRERSLGGRGVRAGLAPRRRRRPRALILLEVVLSLHGVHLARAEPAGRGGDEESVEGYGESLFQGHHARAGRAPARHSPIRRVEALVRRGFGSRRVKRSLRVGDRGKRAGLPGAVRRQPHHGD
mmetsp:Transcript_12394/g.48205  ORF Transcript_12394/g.48205 Transcript_12394/m.48205 type:complete len:310 (-) Transcript_12394:1085-2014(-)